MDSIFTQVANRVRNILADPNIPVGPQDEGRVANAVARQLAPVIANATNQEPLYKSRVVRGGVLVLIGVAASYFGLNFTEGDAEELLTNVTRIVEVFGALFALYGRVFAGTKPPPVI